MIRIVELAKQALAAGAASFVAAWPAAFAGDLTAAKAAVVAGIAAAAGVAAGAVGNLIKQAIQKARGIIGAGSEAALGLLDQAEAAIEEAKKHLA